MGVVFSFVCDLYIVFFFWLRSLLKRVLDVITVHGLSHRPINLTQTPFTEYCSTVKHYENVN